MDTRHVLDVHSHQTIEFIDITAHIQTFLDGQDHDNGALLVYTPHTTAAVTINENADPAVKKDIKEFLLRKIPHEAYFTHMEGNSPAHIMSSLFSASEIVIFTEKKLQLGTWQGIFFCEFDGPRSRKIFLKILR